MEQETKPKRLVDPVRKAAAINRWKLVINVLTGKNFTTDPSVSVRRFASFGLLKTAVIDSDSETVTLNNGQTAEKKHIWYSYTSPGHPQYNVHIRHLDGSLDISDVLGFNNTGNVCVWPSEEILTHYCLKNPHLFRKKSVCELGGGMTCLAGIAVASCTEASSVLLTDGNDNSIRNLDVITERNKDRFGATDVTSKVLRWNECSDDVASSYDVVICADCLFFDDYRSDLVEAINKLLRPEGQVIIFAPRRGKTFHQFVDLLDPYFTDVTQTEMYDEHIWSLHNQNLAKGLDVYDPNLHYPLMLTFSKRAEKTD